MTKSRSGRVVVTAGQILEAEKASRFATFTNSYRVLQDKNTILAFISPYSPTENMGSYVENLSMNVLITGAGGFIGQALAKALLQDNRISRLTLTDVIQPSLPSNAGESRCQTITTKADLTQSASWQELISPELTHVYLLHGVMSGAAEANLELGLRVNVDSMRLAMDALRTTAPGVRVIFPSSLAVFGPLLEGSVVDENTITLPKSSYGAQKQMTETLLNDFSRRGLLDGRIVRLPTIIVRPGQPSGAASSFCSGIIREPLKGQSSILPVASSLKLWVCSTRTIIRNLLTAAQIPAASFAQGSRIINLPGITVTVEEMIQALSEVGGKQAVDLVEHKFDKAVANIVGSWPAYFDITKALSLGFSPDGSLVGTIREYVEDYGNHKTTM